MLVWPGVLVLVPFVVWFLARHRGRRRMAHRPSRPVSTTQRFGIIGATGSGKTSLLVSLLLFLTTTRSVAKRRVRISPGLERQFHHEARHAPPEPTATGRSDMDREWIEVALEDGRTIVIQAYPGEVMRRPDGGVDSQGLRSAFESAGCGVAGVVNTLHFNPSIGARCCLDGALHYQRDGMSMIDSALLALREVLGVDQPLPALACELQQLDERARDAKGLLMLVRTGGTSLRTAYAVELESAPIETDLPSLVLDQAISCGHSSALVHDALRDILGQTTRPSFLVLTRLDLRPLTPALSRRAIRQVQDYMCNGHARRPEQIVLGRSYRHCAPHPMVPVPLDGAAAADKRIDPQAGGMLFEAILAATVREA